MVVYRKGLEIASVLLVAYRLRRVESHGKSSIRRGVIHWRLVGIFNVDMIRHGA